MPCIDYPHSCEKDDKEVNDLQEKVQILEKRVIYYKQKANESASLLCSLMTEIEKINSFSEELKDWWEKHKKFDDMRKLPSFNDDL